MAMTHKDGEMDAEGERISSQVGSGHKNSSSIVKRGKVEYLNKDAGR